jgi:glycosyltransferase involved in cell wall biosynthesis
MGVRVTFVLPRVKERPSDSPVRLMGANEVDLDATWNRLIDEGSLRLLKVDSSLRPYVNDEQYREMMRKKLLGGDLGGGGILEMSGDYGDNLMEEVSRYARVARALGVTEEFDVIHAHDWMTFPAGVEAKRSSGKPLVIHVHATEFDRSGEAVDQRVYDIERYGMEMADRIVAVSNRTRAMIIERYGISPEKVETVYNGVLPEEHTDRSQSGKTVSGKIVLFLGRVTMQKGPEYFIEAAHLVLQKMKNVRFVMAGAGDMLPRMIERMAQLRILEHFHFTGFLRGDKRERVFAMSDLYVMPSVSEPFGLTPVEAMQYDVPIIVSNQSGVAEVLNHVVKVDFWDTRKLADAMIEVLTNPGMARRMVEQSRAELEMIDWDTAAAAVNEIYRRLA